VQNRTALEGAMAAAKQRHGENPPRPPHWGGYRVVAREIEFWQGRSDRLHDRLRYRRQGGAWTIERLSP
jgi:pyridoxamine 5'-phosphate oxidase